MINGMLNDVLITVEAMDPYSFANECNQVLQHQTGDDRYYEISNTYVDMYYWKAIFQLKRPE